MGNKNKPKRIEAQLFLNQIYQEYHASQRYCFILGAGASKTSGIRTGEEMMREWRDYLLNQGSDYIADCARGFELEPDDYQSIFKQEHVLKNDDYFTLFDLRFAGMPNAGYAYLEKEMEGKYPSYGYYPLAMLLSNTKNRLIITTNFDFLIEDALHTYTSRHPLVVGHESLAPYIENDNRRPVIAKIHRDLLLHPLNRKSEMEKLKKEWVKPLSTALSKYIPIVIGYAGGDRTLMALLDEGEIKLGGIYWCYLTEPSDEIKRIVSKYNGYLVKISSFDEIMFRIGERFSAEVKLEDPRPYIQEQAKKRSDLYQQSYLTISDKCKIQKDGRPVPVEAALDADKFARKVMDEAAANLFKAVDLYSEAIRLAPDNIEHYRKRSRALYSLERYQEALWDDTKVIELDPLNSENYNDRCNTLYLLNQYEEALRDETRAIELTPSEPLYYSNRGGILYRMKRYKAALRDMTRAIELAPSNPNYYNGRANTLHALKQYEDEYRDRTKAIELAPSNPQFYSNRSAALYAMQRYKAALMDDTRAIELDPFRAIYYTKRAATLRQLGRDDEAQQDEEKAAELE